MRHRVRAVRERKRQTGVETTGRSFWEKERVIAELRFDLRRARSAAGQPESQWAAREEELMALSTRAMRLEDFGMCAHCLDIWLAFNRTFFQCSVIHQMANHVSFAYVLRVTT
eukprot:2959832-Amphidinium_carterae.1